MNRFARLPHISRRHEQRQARYLAAGLWRRETLGMAFVDAARRQPAQEWHFIRTEPERETRASMSDLAAKAAAFAGELRADSSVSADTAVALVLPNSAGAVSAFFGTLQAGAVAFTVSLREGRESLGELLAMVGSRHLVLTDDDERIAWIRDYQAAGLVDRIWIADELGGIVALDRPRGTPAPSLSPNDVCAVDGVHVVSYTSGSTALPKVVLYTDAQLLSEIRGLRATIDSRGALLVPSPVGHITGVLNLFLMPLTRPDSVVSVDRWNAELAIELTRRFGCSELRGTTLYFQQMADAAGDLGGLKAGMAGGGPVAPSIVRRCHQAGVTLLRSYGSTEHPTVTNCAESDSLEHRSLTDGRPTTGTELKLVGPDGDEVPVGSPGEIMSRGPDAMAGYLDPDLDAQFMSADGWFQTGDVGILNPAGYLTISDRIKDIIIRGAENISAKEVEDQLHEWEAIAEVSVVGVPDVVYGERACAFIIPAGPPLSVADLQTYLATTRLEKFKWPEHARMVDDFPRTASGKVRKRSLRESWESNRKTAANPQG